MPREDEEWVDVTIDNVIYETEDAYLCLIAEEKVWIPISQIEDETHLGVGCGAQQICIPEWLATDKGLI